MEMRTGEFALQIEACNCIPRVVELARQKGRVTRVSMLRYLDIPYGVSGCALDVMQGAGLIVPDADGYRLNDHA